MIDEWLVCMVQRMVWGQWIDEGCCLVRRLSSWLAVIYGSLSENM